MSNPIRLNQLVSRLNAINCPMPTIMIDADKLERNLSKQLSEKASISPDSKNILVNDLEVDIELSYNMNILMGNEGIVKAKNKVFVDVVVNESGITTHEMKLNKTPIDLQIISLLPYSYIGSDSKEYVVPMNEDKSLNLDHNGVGIVLRSNLNTAAPKMHIRKLVSDCLSTSQALKSTLKQTQNHSRIQL